jgi:hypothetical protein
LGCSEASSQRVTIDLLKPARRASWSGDSNGIKSCHLRSFAPSPEDGTHVINVEMFAGGNHNEVP